MKHCRKLYFSEYLSILLVGIIAAPAISEDSKPSENWGNFRGPQHTGVSLTATPPLEWSASKNVAWKVEIPGRGSSSPIVWEDKIFLTTAVNEQPNRKPAARMNRREIVRKFDANGDGRIDDDERNEARSFMRKQQATQLTEHSFIVMCLDRKSGKTIWQDTANQRKPIDGHHQHSGYASASPVTDGEHVYFNFGSMGLYCYDLEGKQVWKRTDLGQMQMRGSFGEGSSVALSDHLLILPWDHEGQSKIEAINKRNGETVWKKDRDEPSAWATPVIVTVNGKQQIIHSGEFFSRGYDLQTGEEIWRSSGLSSRPVATPVAKGNVGFFASSRRGSKLNAYALDRKGDISANAVWKINERTPDCPSLLLSENRLYFIGKNEGIVSCANSENGKLLFGGQRLSGFSGVYSSPVAANGRVYITGRGGKTVVIQDNERYELLAKNEIGEPVDATLALVDDQIFIRGNQHLFCIQESK